MIFREVLYNSAADVILGNDEFEQVRPREVFPEVLRTCHQYYHEGREFLFLNKITFSREGRELLDVIKPLGILSCCSPDCEAYGKNPKLRSARFLIGDNTSSIEGDLYTKSFRCNLHVIRGPIEIGALTIELKMFCWAHSNKPWMFCIALERINLKEQLTMMGIGYYDEALTTDSGDMKHTLCAGKPQVRVVEPACDLVNHLNTFASHPFLRASENVEDVAFTARANMMTFTVDTAGNHLRVDDDFYVSYYAAQYRWGDIRAMADVINPPLIVSITIPWNNPVIPAGVQNQQPDAGGNNAGVQMLQNVVYDPNAQ